MARIILTMSDQDFARVVDAFCSTAGWTPESGAREGFARAQIAALVRSTTQAVERARAEQAALAAAAGIEEIELVPEPGDAAGDLLEGAPAVLLDLDDNPLLRSNL